MMITKPRIRRSVSSCLAMVLCFGLVSCAESPNRKAEAAVDAADNTGTADADLCGEPPGILGEWVCIAPGRFEQELGRCSGETGAYITLTRPYWIMRSDVKMAQWREFMPDADYPAWTASKLEFATWPGAIVFANRASEAAGLEPCYPTALLGGCSPGAVDPEAEWFEYRCVSPPDLPANLDCNGFRLPLEAEWDWIVSEGGTLDTRDRFTIGGGAWGVEGLNGDNSEYLFDRFPLGEGPRPEPYPAGEYIDPVRHELTESDSWVYRLGGGVTRLDPGEFCDDHYFKPTEGAAISRTFRLVQTASPPR